LLGINTAIFTRSGGNQESALPFRKSARESCKVYAKRVASCGVHGGVGANPTRIWLTPMKLKGQPTGALVASSNKCSCGKSGSKPEI